MLGEEGACWTVGRLCLVGRLTSVPEYVERMTNAVRDTYSQDL